MTSKKLERTLNLLAELLNAESPKTAAELKARVGMYPDDLAAFRRTFDRDKNALRDMGVQLELTMVPGTNPPVEGYFIDKSGYYLDELNLTEEEVTALNFAIASIDILDGLTEGEAMRKLGGYEESETSNILKVENRDVGDVSELFDSIARRRKISFMYGNKNRNVEPWRLEFTNGRWYLTGRNIPEYKTKTFRVDKIADLESENNDESYDIPVNPPRVNLKPWSYGDEEAIKTTIRIDSDLLDWARTSLEIDIEIEQSGSGVATIEVNNREAFFARLTLLLDHAEIITPDEMRNGYLAYIGKYIEGSNGAA
ncbi:MAG: WYL domain-containing protein [Actinomycetota bacterium]|nr:WYL domain-containing protein [Actinomycetota bacterium]